MQYKVNNIKYYNKITLLKKLMKRTKSKMMNYKVNNKK